MGVDGLEACHGYYSDGLLHAFDHRDFLLGKCVNMKRTEMALIRN